MYLEARDSIIHFEVVEGERMTDQIIEVRDAFDHIARAVRSDSEDDWRDAVAQVRDHLRRAAVEPAQFAVEARLAAIGRALRFYELRRIVLTELPSRRTVEREVRAIKHKLAAARTDKAKIEEVSSTVAVFREAHVEAANLHDQVTAGAIQLWVRLGLYSLIPIALGAVAFFF